MAYKKLYILFLLPVFCYCSACKKDNEGLKSSTEQTKTSNFKIEIDEKKLGPRQNIMLPIQISHLYESMFFCDGRSWNFNEELIPKKKNSILYLNLSGNDCISTAPEEVNEKKIIIKGKKAIIIKFSEKITKKVIVKTEIGTNEFKVFNNEFNILNTEKLNIPLPPKGISMNRFEICFVGEKLKIGVSSIYLR